MSRLRRFPPSSEVRRRFDRDMSWTCLFEVDGKLRPTPASGVEAKRVWLSEIDHQNLGCNLPRIEAFIASLFQNWQGI